MVTTSECQFFDLPDLKPLEKRKKIQQKRLSKKQKRSNNFKKQNKKVAKISSKISNIRKDFLHKVSTNLVKNHNQIKLEKLNVKNMTKSAKGDSENHGKNVKQKSGLNREILNQGWYNFQTFLEYKSIWFDSKIEYVDPKFTSQTCSKCGNIKKENRNGSKFNCLSCGFSQDADINAAINILRKTPLGKRGELVESNISWTLKQESPIKILIKNQNLVEGVSIDFYY